MNYPCVVALTLAIAHAHAAHLNPANLVVARLQDGISSRTAHRGDPVRAVVVSGTCALPQRTVLDGVIEAVHRVGAGVVHERALLKVQFRSWEAHDGIRRPLDASLVDVDNAREQVGPDGRITGILAAGGPPGFLLGMWQRPTDDLFSRTALGLAGVTGFIGQHFRMDPIGIFSVAAVRMAVVPAADPEIWLPAGTDFVLSVAGVTTECAERPDLAPVPPNLKSWADALPIETSRERNGDAADFTNVVFLGSRDQVMEAFIAAGWREAEPFTRTSFLHLYQAMSAQRGYPTAPMSTLTLDDRAPDLELEKSLNTVARRHHVRVWRRGEWEGREAWVGAATHDRAIRLSAHGFTHSIDRDIDRERGRIIDDLTFAGCVDRVQMVDRQDGSAALVGEASSDGRIAVLSLRSCRPSPAVNEAAPRLEPLAERLVRRIVLEARYSVFRGNVYYWGYRAARAIWVSARRGREAAAEQDPTQALRASAR